MLRDDSAGRDRIMQDVYTSAGTDQCQLLEYGPYNYVNTVKPR